LMLLGGGVRGQGCFLFGFVEGGFDDGGDGVVFGVVHLSGELVDEFDAFVVVGLGVFDGGEDSGDFAGGAGGFVGEVGGDLCAEFGEFGFLLVFGDLFLGAVLRAAREELAEGFGGDGGCGGEDGGGEQVFVWGDSLLWCWWRECTAWPWCGSRRGWSTSGTEVFRPWPCRR